MKKALTQLDFTLKTISVQSNIRGALYGNHLTKLAFSKREYNRK